MTTRRGGKGRGRFLDMGLWCGLWGVAVGGCSWDHRASDAGPVVRDSAGVAIVESSAPQWGTEDAWCLGTEITSVGDLDGAPPYQLFSVLDATRLSDGTVVVGNASTGELRFFGQDGVFIRSVGSVDGGPGEFRGANALRAVRRIPGDSIFTWDLFAQVAQVFAPNGDFVRFFRLEGPARMQFFQGIHEDGSLVMMAYDYQGKGPDDGMAEGFSRQRMNLFRYGSDHRLLETRAGVPGGDQFQAQFGESGVFMVVPAFARVSTVVTDARRTYVATGDADEIAVFDQLATPAKLIRRTGTTKSLTSDMIERDRARRMAGDTSAQAEEAISPRARRLFAEMPYPEVVPPYGRILADQQSNLWVQAFRIRDEDAQEWSVFDDEGVWLGQVEVPSRLRVLEIGVDYVLGRARDDLGVERVVVLRLRKGGGCGAGLRGAS